MHTTPGTAAGLRHDQPARLATSLVVREDSLTLYGFASDAGPRDLFDLVQTVSGVGPRLALAMLSVHPPDELRRALGEGDVVVLGQGPGIGKKGAERLVLELRDRVGPVPHSAAGAASTPAAPDDWRDEVTQALVGLGWASRQAERALDAIAEDLGPNPKVTDALRAALRELGR